MELYFLEKLLNCSVSQIHFLTHSLVSIYHRTFQRWFGCHWDLEIWCHNEDSHTGSPKCVFHTRGLLCLCLRRQGGPRRNGSFCQCQLWQLPHALLLQGGRGDSAAAGQHHAPAHCGSSDWSSANHAVKSPGVPSSLGPKGVQRSLEWNLRQQPWGPGDVLCALPWKHRGHQYGQGLHGEDGSSA